MDKVLGGTARPPFGWLGGRRAIARAVGWPRVGNLAKLAELVAKAASLLWLERPPGERWRLDQFLQFWGSQRRQKTRVVADAAARIAAVRACPPAPRARAIQVQVFEEVSFR